MKKTSGFRVVVNETKGTVRILKYGSRTLIGHADFCFDGAQIDVSYVRIIERYRRTGYGVLLFDAIKVLAKQRQIVIYLCSTYKALKFYQNLGFELIINAYKAGKIRVGNIREGKSIEDVASDTDIFWVPRQLKDKKPVIYV